MELFQGEKSYPVIVILGFCTRSHRGDDSERVSLLRRGREEVVRKWARPLSS